MIRLFDMARARLRALLRSEAVDAELQAEMRAHVDRLVDEGISRGLAPELARAAAQREFGPLPQLVEESRDARGVAWIVAAMADMRYGVRLLRRAPGFAAAATLTVALGIGATTAMFSVVYGVLLRPLPYGDPDRLVNVWSTAPSRGLPRAYVAMANVYDYKTRNHVFEDVAAMRAIANFNLAGQGSEPERLLGGRIAANLLPLLRASPIVGRAFTEEEDEIGHEQVAILSDGLWRRRFGGDPTVIGQSISLSGVPHTVVGVMGPDFAFPSRDYQIWTPLTFDPEELITRQNYSYLAVARLKRDVTLQQARAEMDVIAAQIVREHPKEAAGIGVEVAPMLDDTVAPVRTPLYVLLAAVMAMLLIGCANLANLLLARALSRQRELAVRAALGAGRLRLVVQSIAEIVPLLAIGGALGLIAAVWAIDAVAPLLPADLPRAENIRVHLPVLAFAVAMVGAIGVGVGAWPALEVSRAGLTAATADLSRGVTGGVRRARARDLLVVAQIAATLWLAVCATLLTRSFAELKRVDPGFNPDRVLQRAPGDPAHEIPNRSRRSRLHAPRPRSRVHAAGRRGGGHGQPVAARRRRPDRPGRIRGRRCRRRRAGRRDAGRHAARHARLFSRSADSARLRSRLREHRHRRVAAGCDHRRSRRDARLPRRGSHRAAVASGTPWPAVASHRRRRRSRAPRSARRRWPPAGVLGLYAVPHRIARR